MRNVRIAHKNIKSIQLNPTEYSKKIEKQNDFEEAYDSFRDNIGLLGSKLGKFKEQPDSKTMNRDIFFLSLIYTICEYKSDKVSLYKRANQLKAAVLSYIQGAKSKSWDKYLNKYPYSSSYDLKSDKEEAKKLSEDFRPLTRYLVTLCKCLGTERNAKNLEYMVRNRRRSMVNGEKISIGDELKNFYSTILPPFLGEEPIPYSDPNFDKTKSYKVLQAMDRRIGYEDRIYVILLNIKCAYKKKNYNEYKRITDELTDCKNHINISDWIAKYEKFTRVKNNENPEIAKVSSSPNSNKDKQPTDSKEKKKSRRHSISFGWSSISKKESKKDAGVKIPKKSHGFNLSRKKNSNSQGSDNSHSSRGNKKTLRKHGLFHSKTARGSNEV